MTTDSNYQMVIGLKFVFDYFFQMFWTGFVYNKIIDIFKLTFVLSI